MSVLPDLLDDVAAAREKLIAAMQDGSAAPSFNPLRFCRTDELGLSQMLAWLLDPTEDHGGGAAFLVEFARTFGLEPEKIADPRCVLTEVLTDEIEADKRRMDITVECGGYVLAIENKPWAGFQDRQIPDYCRNLDRKTGGNYNVVILKGRLGVSPRTQLAPDGVTNERIVDADYAGVVEWLEACLALRPSPRVAIFIDSLKEYLAETMFGRPDRQERKMVMEAIDTIERKRAALDVIAAADALYHELHQTLVEEVRRSCPARWKVAADRSGRAGRANLGFHHVTIDMDSALPVVAAIDFPPFSGDAQLGLVRREDVKHVTRKLDRITERLDENVYEARTYGNWIWWEFIGTLAEEKVMAIEPTSDAWKALLEPSAFARVIVDTLERLRKESRSAIRGM